MFVWVGSGLGGLCCCGGFGCLRFVLLLWCLYDRLASDCLVWVFCRFVLFTVLVWFGCSIISIY